jgi:lysyl-tRNA synthetase class 2
MRLERLQGLKDTGAEPYPYGFVRTHHLAEIIDSGEELLASSVPVSLAGRMMSKRRHGKAGFAHIEDELARLQIYLRKDEVGEENYELFKLLEVGDFVGVEGSLMRTKTGELTVHVQKIVPLTKALRPLPEKWHGLTDKEIRYRQRYLDLIMNQEVRATFRRRSEVIATIREVLLEENFLEVETPILQPLYGGATARPFTTNYHSLSDMKVYLRIANELYLKRLIVGGFDRVFEFAKDFRNEGMDRTHNPEFTMMECYAAYWDYVDVMNLVERIFARLVERFTEGGILRYGEHEIDFSHGFRRARFLELLHEKTGIDFAPLSPEEIRVQAKTLGVEVDESMGKGKLLDEVFSAKVEPDLVQPTFVCDHPKELSPLAKAHRSDSELVERFEPFVAGFEVGNAFSELNDPQDQRARFEDQLRLREEGDEEAQQLDQDFLRALEYGMPPTGGLGLGIDRIVMLFTDSHSIRDVLFFPQMRSEAESS